MLNIFLFISYFKIDNKIITIWVGTYRINSLTIIIIRLTIDKINYKYKLVKLTPKNNISLDINQKNCY